MPRKGLALTGLTALASLVVSGCTDGTKYHFPDSSSSGTTSAAATVEPAPRPQAVYSTNAPVGSWSSTLPPPVYGTRKCWPIVFVHGMGGFTFQIGSTTYWNEVPQALEAAGFEVMVASVEPFDTVQVRAAELYRQILARYPDPRVKVNLVGHSMGGLDCRYLVSTLKQGEKVATVTTFATPHRGSPAADVIFGLIAGPIADTTEAIMKTFGQDVVGGGTELTTAWCKNTFNPQNPDDPRVAYFSWAGLADPTGAPPRGTLDPFLIPTWAIVAGLEGDNDGLVSLGSAKWGQFQGTVPADHWREVGLPSPSPQFDQKAFFLARANELEARGFGPSR